MQKLVWKNANGVELDLTSGNYGITEWEGFSNASLNVQTQTVPFQDGAVFLDALVEQRELSVTLAMQDNNNLELRYQQRREIISALNPKLGEGYLIYTNDFITKRIKCVPQIPLFETHNSDTAGTPKASLSWTACNPYWEDLEDTVVNFGITEQPIITNEGDTPIQVEMTWSTNGVTDGEVINNTTNQKIKYDGVLHNTLKIDTRVGQKSVVEETSQIKNLSLGVSYNKMIVVNDLMVIIGDNGVILTKQGNETPIPRFSGTSANLKGITYSEEQELFVVVGDGGVIITSQDAIVWELQTSGVSFDLTDVTYSPDFEVYYALPAPTANNRMLKSSDAVTWTTVTSGQAFQGFAIKSLNWELRSKVVRCNLHNIQRARALDSFEPAWSDDNKNLTNLSFIKEKAVLFACGENFILKCTTEDTQHRLVFTEISMTFTVKDILYNPLTELYLAIGNQKCAISADGENWTTYTQSYNFSSGGYAEGYIYCVGADGTIARTSDMRTWETVQKGFNKNVRKVIKVEELGLYVAVGDAGFIATSPDLINWTSRESGTTYNLVDVVYSKRYSKLVAIGQDGNTSNGVVLGSNNGITWNTEKNITDISIKVCGLLSLEDKIIFSNYPRMVYIYDQIQEWFSINAFGGTKNIEKDGYVYASAGATVLKTNIYNIISVINPATTESREINDFLFVGEKMVCVGNGGLIGSCDGGDTYYVRESGTTEDLLAIVYVPSQVTFYVVGKNGTILKSTDAEHWEQVLETFTLDLNTAIYDENVYIAGNSGIIQSIEKGEETNAISKISADSDVGFKLAIGENHLRINKQAGNMIVQLKYRQKYIGV